MFLTTRIPFRPVEVRAPGGQVFFPTSEEGIAPVVPGLPCFDRGEEMRNCRCVRVV